MQKLFLLLTFIISRAVPSPIAQFGPDDSFNIALSGFDVDDGTFQLASSETSPQPQEAPAQPPAQAPAKVPQPGELKPIPQPKPNLPNPQKPPGSFTQPFSCAEGKTGACCVGGTRDGVTSGCIPYVPWDDWCQNHDAFKCCNAQPEKDAAISAGTLVDDTLRENCEDPKEVEWTTQQKFENFGNNLLRVIIPQVDTGLSFPKPVFIPNQ